MPLELDYGDGYNPLQSQCCYTGGKTGDSIYNILVKVVELAITIDLSTTGY